MVIRETERGWEASVYIGQLLCVVVGDTPQRAVLRLALALISKPNEQPHLDRLFGIDDPATRCAICDAESALRKSSTQISDGNGSVEQCQ